MAREVVTSGGDARLGGGVSLGTPGHAKPGPNVGKRGAHGETIHRGGGKGLGTPGKEKPAAPKTRVHGESIPATGGKGLGTPGTEKLGGAADGPHGGTHYADPGFQKDGKHRLPVHTEAHTRASMRVFNKIKGTYNERDAKKIGLTISAAAKTHGIDPYENAMRK